MDISQRVFAPNTNYSVGVSHSIVFQFVTITNSIDVHYYLFNGEEVGGTSVRGISSNGKALTSHVRGTGINTQIVQSLQVM